MKHSKKRKPIRKRLCVGLGKFEGKCKNELVHKNQYWCDRCMKQ